MQELSPKSTIIELRRALDAREISVAEVFELYQRRMQATEKLNAFITIADITKKTIDAAQQKIDAGKASVLTGIPYAAKDVFCTQGLRTTAGSRILEHYIPPYSATAIERCKDALLVGKTNLDEFAMGSSTEFSAFGPTRNPYDLDRVAGGSSGGSAAAVAAGQVPFALGTDTGGSIRLPAAFCNVVGFKPTYGRIPRTGVIAMASSLDTVGFLTKSVADAALLYRELLGPDGKDATAWPKTPSDDQHFLNDNDGIAGIRIGFPKEMEEMEGMDPAVHEAYASAKQLCTQLGAQVVDIALPMTKFALATYYILAPSEVSSNLARYNGMPFGLRIGKKNRNLEETMQQTRNVGFGLEAKRRIMIGTFCLSAGHIDAFYHKALRVRQLVADDFRHAFENVDAVMMPTAPILPFPIGERTHDPLQMYVVDACAIPASLAGLPAISIPGWSAQGLPIGMQVIAAQHAEASVFQIAAVLEHARPAPDLPLAL